MNRSTEKILTTHTGSLARLPGVMELIRRGADGDAVDPDEFDRAANEAVREVVKRQLEAGVSVINDGEQGKTGYADYMRDRVTGFENGDYVERRPSRSVSDFPTYYEGRSGSRRSRGMFVGDGPVAWKDFNAVEKDIARLKGALAGLEVADSFMTSASPATFINHNPNSYYRSREQYLEVAGEVMKREYEAITSAGIVLQLDCPDLAASRESFFSDQSDEEFVKMAEQNIAALNHATRDVPQEMMRIHVCWGAGEQPHNHDIPLEKILGTLLKAHVGAISIVGANGRHDHEWKLWKDVKLPEGVSLIPGVIDNTTNIIEHPQAVADRIVRYASVIGRENVIAGVDCGFAPIGSSNPGVDSMIVWAKLRSLAEGAALATSTLW